MADIRCPRCGEPWDIDCLYDEITYRNPTKPWKTENGGYLNGVYAKLFSAMRKEFRLKGCVALTAYNDHECEPVANAGIFGELMDFAGDDIDFAARMMEDAERWGLV